MRIGDALEQVVAEQRRLAAREDDLPYGPELETLVDQALHLLKAQPVALARPAFAETAPRVAIVGGEKADGLDHFPPSFIALLILSTSSGETSGCAG